MADEPTADENGRIEITDPRDLALLRIAQRALMNSTILPSGYKTPPCDMLVDGTALVPASGDETRGFARNHRTY